jgi:SAM-dependent methyltransferase
MTTAAGTTLPENRFRDELRDAWSRFWADPGQSRCAAGDPEIGRALERHWTMFAPSLPRNARVLDLGCGAGVVARLLLQVRADLRLTGVDSATVPDVISPALRIQSGIDMESLPFPAGTFDAVVSQFGFEYSSTVPAAREMARVLVPGGRIELLVHHSGSAIVASGVARLRALEHIVSPEMSAAFCSGDLAAFDVLLRALIVAHREDPLVEQLARTLPSRLGWPQSRRLAVWRALGDALEPELRVSASLHAACVSPGGIEEWLEPLRRIGRIECATLRETDGAPIAWTIAATAATQDR